MKLRQVVYQACNGIEACEIEFVELSVLKKLLLKAEFAVKRFCNSRLVCHANAGCENGIALLTVANKRYIRSILKRQTELQRPWLERLDFF
jgi:hypothetical protein